MNHGSNTKPHCRIHWICLLLLFKLFRVQNIHIILLLGVLVCWETLFLEIGTDTVSLNSFQGQYANQSHNTSCLRVSKGGRTATHCFKASQTCRRPKNISIYGSKVQKLRYMSRMSESGQSAMDFVSVRRLAPCETVQCTVVHPLLTFTSKGL